MSTDRDKALYGAFGDSVIKKQELEAEQPQEKDPVQRKQSEGPKSFKPNATVYLKSIKEPARSDSIRRRGLLMMMMFIGTETLATQLVNERSRVPANRHACTRTNLLHLFSQVLCLLFCAGSVLASPNAHGLTMQMETTGCTGWPCHDGFLCDFCMLRPEWIAEGKVEPLLEEVSELKQTIANLRAREADVETLRKAERLVAGKYWNAESDTRISTLNSMLEDSRARIEAQEAQARCVAAETVRDSLVTQMTTLQERMGMQEKELTGYKQKVEALNESLADLQHQLRFATSELEEKRMLISDAIKEKSRFRDMSRSLQSTIDVQNHELIVRSEQTKALILEVQRLQGVEGERNKFKEVASQRAMIAQSIMDAVSEDVIMAERMRDEHTHQVHCRLISFSRTLPPACPLVSPKPTIKPVF
jgi:hypothetical protein